MLVVVGGFGAGWRGVGDEEGKETRFHPGWHSSPAATVARRKWHHHPLYHPRPGTAAYFTDRVAVIYLGRIAEIGATKTVLSDSKHPYTQVLLSVIPSPNPRLRWKRMILVGETSNPIDLPSGCRFHPRCPAASDLCSQIEPRVQSVGPDHIASRLAISPCGRLCSRDNSRIRTNGG
jgi:oligopeptide/dipeptide ABC transporter ATP-binding protein